MFEISFFQLMQKEFDASLPTVRLTKQALVQLGHVIECTLVSNKIPALFFSSYEPSQYWLSVIDEQHKQSVLANAPCLFCDEIQDKPSLDAIIVPLYLSQYSHQEWFFAVLSSKFNLLVCGREQPELVIQDKARLFDTMITFEPTVIAHTLDLIGKTLFKHYPDKHQRLQLGQETYPHTNPDAAYLSMITSQFLEQNSVPNVVQTVQSDHTTIAQLTHEASQPITMLISLLEFSQHVQQVLPQEIDMLLEAANQLNTILEQLKKIAMTKEK